MGLIGQVSAALWVGPAVVAALIAGLIQVVGWRWSERREIRADGRRRAERVRDIQAALQAEIRSIVGSLGAGSRAERDAASAALVDRILSAGPDGFTPFVTKVGRPAIFENVVKEIHILPVEVIDPVVLFYRQMAVLSDFSEDLRSSAFAALAADRKARMFADYGDLRELARTLGETALKEIGTALEKGSGE